MNDAPDIGIAEPAKGASGVPEIQSILRPDPSNLYRLRAERLRSLGSGHEAQRAMSVAADVAWAQHQVVTGMPLRNDDYIRGPIRVDHVSLDAFLYDLGWLRSLEAILELFVGHPVVPVRQSAEALFEMDWTDAATRAIALLRLDFSQVLPGEAVLLWAATGLVWAQRAAGFVNAAESNAAEENCPVCGAMPVGSILLDGGQAGLRYLHCSLCESRWHRVRAHCSNCSDPRPTALWGFEDAMPGIHAESCDACRGYLKRFNPEEGGVLEIVADDLASLDLDRLIEERGFGRTGINPLSLPADPGRSR